VFRTVHKLPAAPHAPKKSETHKHSPHTPGPTGLPLANITRHSQASASLVPLSDHRNPANLVFLGATSTLIET